MVCYFNTLGHVQPAFIGWVGLVARKHTKWRVRKVAITLEIGFGCFQPSPQSVSLTQTSGWVGNNQNLLRSDGS